jgi:hypothetical protein
MLSHVERGAESHEVFKRVFALPAPLDLVMYLKVLRRSAPLTPPLMPVMKFLDQPLDDEQNLLRREFCVHLARKCSQVGSTQPRRDST